MRSIFIHVPKTGGNALQRCERLRTLLARFGPAHMPEEYVANVRAAMAKHGLKDQFGHARWRDLKPEFSGKYPAVAIVRNPWARVVSSYTFAQKIEREHNPQNAAAMAPGATFEQFLEMRLRWGHEPYFWHRTTVGWYSQVDYVTDADDVLRCDILRFEHYDADTMRYFGLTEPIEKRNVSNDDSRDYREFYTYETRAAVAQWYSKDIDFFGFTFDGAATRNTWA